MLTAVDVHVANNEMDAAPLGARWSARENFEKQSVTSRGVCHASIHAGGDLPDDWLCLDRALLADASGVERGRL